MAGFLRYAGRRRRLDLADALAIATSGARGDPAEIKKELRDLRKD